MKRVVHPHFNEISSGMGKEGLLLNFEKLFFFGAYRLYWLQNCDSWRNVILGRSKKGN